MDWFKSNFLGFVALFFSLMGLFLFKILRAYMFTVPFDAFISIALILSCIAVFQKKRLMPLILFTLCLYIFYLYGNDYLIGYNIVKIFLQRPISLAFIIAVVLISVLIDRKLNPSIIIHSCGATVSVRAKECPKCKNILNSKKMAKFKCRTCGEELFANAHYYVSYSQGTHIKDGTSYIFSSMSHIPCKKCSEPKPVPFLYKLSLFGDILISTAWVISMLILVFFNFSVIVFGSKIF